MEDGIRYINLEYFFNQIYQLFTGGVDGSFSAGGTGSFILGLKSFFLVTVRFIMPLCIIILLGLYIYYYYKCRDIVALERNRAYERIDRTQRHYYKDTRNTRWDQVVELFTSTIPSDWRIGIIEADAMLDSLVTSLGYTGDTLGEKLQNIDKGNFPTLDLAWEVHKIRNRIAHDGVEFQISEGEKNEVFLKYEKIFTDAEYI